MRCLFVLILYIFFPLAAKLRSPRTGCQFFKKILFFQHLTPQLITYEDLSNWPLVPSKITAILEGVVVL